MRTTSRAQFILALIGQERTKVVGRPVSTAGVIAKSLRMECRAVRAYGLDIQQTELAWTCRYNEMIRLQKNR